jgi:hypothetical protein
VLGAVAAEGDGAFERGEQRLAAVRRFETGQLP